MTVETYTEVAIRLKQGMGGGFGYINYREDGTRNLGPLKKLTVETAKKQLSLYTATAEATVVTREVTKTCTDWEVLEVSEVKLLAEILHKKQCHVSHEDQCDWQQSDSSHARKNYEAKAEGMLALQSFENIKELIKFM